MVGQPVRFTNGRIPLRRADSMNRLYSVVLIILLIVVILTSVLQPY